MERKNFKEKNTNKKKDQVSSLIFSEKHLNPPQKKDREYNFILYSHLFSSNRFNVFLSKFLKERA